MESFDELVVQYQPMIHKIIQSLHIYRNQDEFYQTGLIGLWEASQSYNEGKGRFSNYAYSYMKGKMLTQMNQDNQYQGKYILSNKEAWENIEGQESLYLEKETFQTYCDGLTEKETTWVIAFSIEQLTIKEIAEREKVSLSAVKQWRSGAIRKLKEKVDSLN
ncbi:sigma-70 family RNA polymerase sigma factor [Neobacillus sp. CF12]|uniref:sigma-70 family RNA polymerase sigma factor n=1 Tax=Neobacillus sp. CF12 TaxID=3055864 RepID=UPI0025A16752|nr:sigma-70 family RNA polymerase sigma factor [Neobacillus sp. CF12]MDM5329897.1 sigma-70 family RNA polymerase sigma factor [Neobacillus sp. CF12]